VNEFMNKDLNDSRCMIEQCVTIARADKNRGEEMRVQHSTVQHQ
jgi:hypothetical protein